MVTLSRCWATWYTQVTWFVFFFKRFRMAIFLGRLDELLVEKMSQDHFSVKQQSKCLRRVLIGWGVKSPIPKSLRFGCRNVHGQPGGFNDFFFGIFTPKIGEDEPNLTVAYFSDGVGEKPPTSCERKMIHSVQTGCPKHIRLGNGRYGASWWLMGEE